METKRIAIAFSLQDHARLAAMAREARMPLSTFLRGIIVAYTTNTPISAPAPASHETC